MKATAGRKKPARAQPQSRTKRKARARSWHFTSAHLKAVPADDPARVYFEHIAETPKQHNRWIHLAARRHTIDLLASVNDPDFPYVYDCALAARPAAFAEQFKGLEGPLAGKALKLLNWQRWIVAMLYGWRHREDPRRRRFNYAYIEVARKNGKTGFVAPLGLYQLGFPPPGARCEVYSVATKLEQANIVWRDGCRLLRTAQGWARLFRERHNRLTHNPSDSDWRPLGADKSTLDGLRPELAIMDELHAWPDRGLWDVINSAFGAAFSPLVLQITTAGDNPEGICMEQQQRVCRLLDSVERGTYTGREGDAAFYFGAIWTIDPTDRWDDPAIWIKANPSLGVVKPMSEMHKLAVGARVSPGARREFLIKQLNCWQKTGFTQWLDQALWDRCHTPLNPKPSSAWGALKGLPCWFGLDPSSRQDITALCAIAAYPDDPEVIIVAWDFWVPGEDLSSRVATEILPYDLWAREEWVNITDGNAIDINRIKERCITRRAEVDLQLMGFDEGSSQGIGVSLLNDHEFPVHAVQQGYRLGPALQEIERLVLKGNLRHFGNPVAASQFARCAIVQGDSQIRLVKAKSKGRIDGIAALAMAIAARQHSLSAPDQGAGCSWV